MTKGQVRRQGVLSGIEPEQGRRELFSSSRNFLIVGSINP